ncbi:ACP S-malonyltransferase [Photobacterium lutimaris]|uniref:[acyl-carrier-protein] S-malonyltransferase n=1 Tax=Photobacterium lutimaris TaxID=388278 RepID=A0A2T3J2F8_9GAMM|nr:ACP S-malonyltransferase [Photobacterium lutimaris]PSU35481.1 [acyl-carrier-protein] S-malonyltransferase [Photobacterium lutimaris]TDR78526.1 trans-AT polyketide synthase/acyltransferase/oxidoreductase domain-containing protein [Photobacterium lutimaris]
MKCVIFPGQGSQFLGMGKDLFDKFPEEVELYNSILGYSLKELCLSDPKQQLKQTNYTQPSIFAVNHLSYLEYLKENDAPDYLAGHSLGEYNALLASQVFDFETGLRLVKRRGELMANATEGGMAAVLGMPLAKIVELIEKHSLNDIEIANINTDLQVVISGKKKAIEESAELFTSNGARYVVLPVSGAFHSTLMQESKITFQSFLTEYTFSKPQIPVISNITARPYKEIAIDKTLSEQITSSVKWSESVQFMMFKGVNGFEEIGPGKVLTSLVSQIKNNAVGLDLYFDEDEEKKESEIQYRSELPETKPKANVASDSGKLLLELTPNQLGSPKFLERYNVKYPYVSGSMYRGIASKEMVVAMGLNGFIGFLGTGGLSDSVIEESIVFIKDQLGSSHPFGVNLLHNEDNPDYENKMVELYLKHDIRNIEASAFITISEALVLYRLKGVSRFLDGSIRIRNHILAKVSRPEIAELFLRPAPKDIVDNLVSTGKLTKEEGELSTHVSLAGEICIEADSGGHTDAGNLCVLLPAIKYLEDRISRKYNYSEKILVGAAGGIGTPSAAAAAFILGADFILTGSINQCSIEAAISEEVKDILETINVQDTAYAPAGDMFEMGAKVQVLKKGVLFPYRANKLYNLYKEHNGIDDIDKLILTQLEKRFFKKTLDEVWAEISTYLIQGKKEELEMAERSPKYKMALIFKWYFNYSTKIALSGSVDDKVNYQVHCGPSLGAFNEWVSGTGLSSWRNRNVHVMAQKILKETCLLLKEQIKAMSSKSEQY